MAKFIYRMQSILDIKLKMEDQAKQAFAAAKIKLDEEQEKLDILFMRKAGYEERGRQLRMQKLDFLEISANRTAIERMEEFIVLQQQRVEHAAQRLERAQDALREVRTERKAQEILKENAFEEFKRELNRAESKEIDELTSYTYGKAGRSAAGQG